MRLKIQAKQQGFSLIEMMVSMAILAFSMLGIASLHLVSLENNHAALLRSQSVTISSDLIERVRQHPALRLYVMKNDIDSSDTFILSTNPGGMLTGCMNNTGCSDDYFVMIELQNWANTVNRLSTVSNTPLANVTLDYDDTNKVFDVAVKWKTKQWQAENDGMTADQKENVDDTLRQHADSTYTFLVAID